MRTSGKNVCIAFLEDYNVLQPDIKRFPALNGIIGKEAFLEHGDTLYMPTGYWHWMKYLSGSFSLNLRAWDPSFTTKLHSIYNLAVKAGLDSVFKMVFKAPYARYREQVAIKRAEMALRRGLPK